MSAHGRPRQWATFRRTSSGICQWYKANHSSRIGSRSSMGFGPGEHVFRSIIMETSTAHCLFTCLQPCVSRPGKDLESRTPHLGPYTTKGSLYEPSLRDLLSRSSRGSGLTVPSLGQKAPPAARLSRRSAPGAVVPATASWRV